MPKKSRRRSIYSACCPIAPSDPLSCSESRQTEQKYAGFETFTGFRRHQGRPLRRHDHYRRDKFPSVRNVLGPAARSWRDGNPRHFNYAMLGSLCYVPFIRQGQSGFARKAIGVYPHQLLKPLSPIVRGLITNSSASLQVCRGSHPTIESVPELEILAVSEHAGPTCCHQSGKHLFVTGLQSTSLILSNEYLRDVTPTRTEFSLFPKRQQPTTQCDLEKPRVFYSRTG